MKRKPHGVKKRPIDPRRIRHIPPEGFSWIDRRFVREGHIDRLLPEPTLLYFFLVAVSDAQGLSFYADPTISKILKLDQQEIAGARGQLVRAGLILYQHPLYQVLPLPPKEERPATPSFSSAARKQREGEFMSLGNILKQAMANADPEESADQKEIKKQVSP